ncbi:response regulator [candidate division WOR-3 bacterium]|nr:response regulator [candidate division WOR-3 bacterium]
MKVLIADDEFTGRMTLEFFIKSFGYEVIVASDGISAWENWRRERPNIVITDWNMPLMDGLELCSKIRESEGDEYTYIIIVTGRGEKQDIVKGLDSGADDYIIKPFNKDEILVRLKSAERVLHLQTKDIVIFSLAKLAESRDTDTGNHLERMRHYSKALAESLAKGPNPPQEIDRNFIEEIYLTSPLHDIGKVGIPDKILLKAGKLDDTEYEKMKNHTLIGFNTLIEAYNKSPRAKYLKMSAEIAKYHHEKYDGTGYPEGLSGEGIPLSARIVALADFYDALVSRRIYKEPYSHETAKTIILQNKGKHFDPMVVEAFLRCEAHFIVIAKAFKE